MSGITTGKIVQSKIKKSKRIEKCEELNLTIWKRLTTHTIRIWKNKAYKDALLEVPILKLKHRNQRCNELNKQDWKDVQDYLRKIRIKRKFEASKIKNPIMKGKKLQAITNDPLGSYPLIQQDIFTFWQNLPCVKKTRIGSVNPTKTFSRALKNIREKLVKFSPEVIKKSMQKYSDFLVIMHRKAPQIFKQFGLNVAINDFFLVPKWTREKISHNAPHREVSSWFNLCRRVTVTTTTLYLRFSYVGRFNINPDNEEIFNFFLGYYWKWFVLPEKSRLLQNKAETVFSDLNRSVLELFESPVINLEEDFDFLVLTKVNSAFQNYISYIKRNHKELLNVENGNAERGVRAVFKCLRSIHNTVPVFYPNDFVKDKTYAKFDTVIADEESELAIRFYSSSPNKRNVKTSNVPNKVRKARRKLVEEMREVQRRISKGIINLEQGQTELTNLRNKVDDPLHEEKLELLEKEKKRRKFEESVLKRRRTVNVDRIKKVKQITLEKAVKTQDLQKSLLLEKKRIRKERIKEDKQKVELIPDFGIPNSILDSKPSTNIVFTIEDSKYNSLEQPNDFIIWEDQILDTFQLREPWTNEFSWTFIDVDTGRDIKVKVPHDSVTSVILKQKLEPPINFRVWTCPNGLVFVDGVPIIKTGKDLQKLTDFEKGILHRPRYYIDWLDSQSTSIGNGLSSIPKWREVQMNIDTNLKKSFKDGKLPNSEIVRHMVTEQDLNFMSSKKENSKVVDLHM